ncbi:MAG TPA: hypothetical protein VGG64_08825 [Pirellulales bacterium]|jgi:hypothetical protein
MSDELCARRLNEALRNHPGVDLQLDAKAAVIVMSQLQLALRHPGNCGTSSLIARAVADNLIQLLAMGDAEVERLLRLGDNPHFDRPVPNASRN